MEVFILGRWNSYALYMNLLTNIITMPLLLLIQLPGCVQPLVRVKHMVNIHYVVLISVIINLLVHIFLTFVVHEPL